MVLKFGVMNNSWGREGEKILALTQVPINTEKISSGKLIFLSVLTYAQHQIYGEIKMYCLLFIYNSINPTR